MQCPERRGRAAAALALLGGDEGLQSRRGKVRAGGADASGELGGQGLGRAGGAQAEHRVAAAGFRVPAGVATAQVRPVRAALDGRVSVGKTLAAAGGADRVELRKNPVALEAAARDADRRGGGRGAVGGGGISRRAGDGRVSRGPAGDSVFARVAGDDD